MKKGQRRTAPQRQRKSPPKQAIGLRLATGVRAGSILQSIVAKVPPILRSYG